MHCLCVCEIEQSSVCSAISCSFIKPTVTIAALKNSNHNWHLLIRTVTIYTVLDTHDTHGRQTTLLSTVVFLFADLPSGASMPFSVVSVAEHSSQRPFKTFAHAYSSPTDSMVILNQKYLKRRVWGTMKSCGAQAVKNTISRLTSHRSNICETKIQKGWFKDSVVACHYCS